MIQFRAVALSLALVACQDEPSITGTNRPEPPTTGVMAFVSVDNPAARVGETVRVRVEVQVGTETPDLKIGSFTGRLRFDPARLAFKAEQPISDGLRVANNTGATGGEIRFAGASPGGFATLVLYDGTFEVKAAAFQQGMTLTMEELSTAVSLTNLSAQLRVSPQVFTSRAVN